MGFSSWEFSKSFIKLCGSHFNSGNETKGFPGALVVKNPPADAGDTEIRVQSLGRDDPPEEEMATHSSVLAWKMPWTEEPGGLQAVGSQRVGHD